MRQKIATGLLDHGQTFGLPANFLAACFALFSPGGERRHGAAREGAEDISEAQGRGGFVGRILLWKAPHFFGGIEKDLALRSKVSKEQLKPWRLRVTMKTILETRTVRAALSGAILCKDKWRVVSHEDWRKLL